MTFFYLYLAFFVCDITIFFSFWWERRRGRIDWIEMIGGVKGDVGNLLRQVYDFA